LTFAARTGEARTSSTSLRVTVFVVGEASASEVAAGVGHEGVEVGLGTEEGRVDGTLAMEAMDVDTIGQV
jgi:hypothetical protein